MSIFTKSKPKIKIEKTRKEGKLFEFLCSYGLILLYSLIFASSVAKFFDFSWEKGLLISFFFGLIMKMLEDLKHENWLLEISCKDNLSEIDALEDRINALEKFIRNEIREDVSF